MLDDRTSENIADWSRAWVEERGRPEFTTSVQLSAKGGLDAVTITQRDPQNTRPDLAAAPARHRRIRRLGQGAACLPDSGHNVGQGRDRVCPRRDTCCLAGGGLGYGLFTLDEGSRDYLLQHIEDVQDPLTRGAAWVTLVGQPSGIARRPDATAGRCASRLAAGRRRAECAARPVVRHTRVLAIHLAGGAGSGARPRSRQRSGPVSRVAARRARRPRGSTPIAMSFSRPMASPGSRGCGSATSRCRGLRLAEPDEIAMALELAVREAPGWDEILRTQIDRTQNPDRKARLAFVAPALSADPAVRERAFARFRFRRKPSPRAVGTRVAAVSESPAP